jgi:hypothetical protein
MGEFPPGVFVGALVSDLRENRHLPNAKDTYYPTLINRPAATHVHIENRLLSTKHKEYLISHHFPFETCLLPGRSYWD